MVFLSRRVRMALVAVAAAGICVVSPGGPSAVSAGSAEDDRVVVRHHGRFLGNPGSDIRFSVVIENGEYVRIERLEFGGVPLRCADDRDGFLWGRIDRIRMTGRTFYRGKPLPGPEEWSRSLFRMLGEVRSNGEKARGKMRSSFVDTSGDECTTGLRSWSTRG